VIARIWHGTTETAHADEYAAHLRDQTLPRLRSIAGHRGAFVLKHARGSQAEFMVMTLWDSLASIREFAGDDAEAAVVPPAAAALLTSYEPRAVHWDVVVC
jgi:heme-degrading monooxygenase HmoA